MSDTKDNPLTATSGREDAFELLRKRSDEGQLEVLTGLDRQTTVSMMFMLRVSLREGGACLAHDDCNEMFATRPNKG